MTLSPKSHGKGDIQIFYADEEIIKQLIHFQFWQPKYFFYTKETNTCINNLFPERKHECLFYVF